MAIKNQFQFTIRSVCRFFSMATSKNQDNNPLVLYIADNPVIPYAVPSKSSMRSL